MICCFIFFANTVAAGTLAVTYNSNNTYTISKGDSFQDWTMSSSNCKKNNEIGLMIQFKNTSSSIYTSTVPGVSTQIIGGTGDCVAAIGNLLPYTASSANPVSCASLYYLNSGKPYLLDGWCIPLENSVEDSLCEITSGDIVHDYGTILTDEVEGKTITTNATISCTGGSSYGVVDVALSLSEQKVELKDDDSLYAQLGLDGKGQSTTATIGINSSTSLSVTSTLHTNGNVSSGAFSGSSVLTMTYY